MNEQEFVMRNKVFGDVRICGSCEGKFVLNTVCEDHVEGEPNPVINDETYEGLFCFECIEIEEKRIEKEEKRIAMLNKVHAALQGLQQEFNIPDENLHLEDGFIFTEYLRDN